MSNFDSDIRRLGEELGVFHTTTSPVKAPSDWLRANLDSIRSTWDGISSLSGSKDDLKDLERMLYPVSCLLGE